MPGHRPSCHVWQMVITHRFASIIHFPNQVMSSIPGEGVIASAAGHPLKHDLKIETVSGFLPQRRFECSDQARDLSWQSDPATMMTVDTPTPWEQVIPAFAWEGGKGRYPQVVQPKIEAAESHGENRIPARRPLEKLHRPHARENGFELPRRVLPQMVGPFTP